MEGKIFILLTLATSFAAAVDPSYFLSFGTTAGDSVLPRGDGNGSPSLAFNFQFWGSNYSTLVVCTNGIISTLPQCSVIPNSGSPTLGYFAAATVAPFWADIETTPSASGRVYYRIDLSNITLSAVSSFVSATQNIPFTAVRTFVATWSRVGYHIQYTDKLNTFQAVLTANAAGETYTIFNYGNLSFTSGYSAGSSNGLGGYMASAGFAKGDGSYAELPRSRTLNILGMKNFSNAYINGVPQLGQYIYKTSVSPVSTTPPVTTAAVTSAVLTTMPLTTSPLTTQPLTTAALTTSPLTTSPLTTAPLTTKSITSGSVTSGRLTSGRLTTGIIFGMCDSLYDYNYNCPSAPVYTAELGINNFSNVGVPKTRDYVYPANICGNVDNSFVWFEYFLPANVQRVTVNITDYQYAHNGQSGLTSVEFFTGSCSNLAPRNCTRGYSNRPAFVSLDVSAYPAQGINSIRIRISESGQSCYQGSGQFTLSVTYIPLPVTTGTVSPLTTGNSYVCTGELISPDYQCSNSLPSASVGINSFTTVGAPKLRGYTYPTSTCGGVDNSFVWFEYSIPSGATQITVNVTSYNYDYNGLRGDTTVEIYTGSCSNLTPRKCTAGAVNYPALASLDVSGYAEQGIDSVRIRISEWGQSCFQGSGTFTLDLSYAAPITSGPLTTAPLTTSPLTTSPLTTGTPFTCILGMVDPNYQCSDSLPSAYLGVNSFTTVGAVKIKGYTYPTSTCGNVDNSFIWFEYALPTNANTLKVNITDYNYDYNGLRGDTTVEIYTGSCSNLTPRKCTAGAVNYPALASLDVSGYAEQGID
eukprot:TRINITY_DN3817_c0_g1_i7.p1 TRINITY_DN3817_c0_g1~~TRINITY_DN3817_c0_g1_i7.p1  ORF type:complete len:809 (-),score=96.21 TRINITY_DN3817_c0_g1_i7:117-2543(-)